jgi:glycosyltransferase involved in cell wall biosynthesis
MKLLMISGDRSLTQGKKGAFWYTLERLQHSFERIDIVCPRVRKTVGSQHFQNVFLHPSPWPLLFQPFWILRKGKELVARHKHEAMTVHDYPPFYNGAGARWLSKRTGVPYAIEIHHIVGYPVASSCAEWFGRVLSRLCLPWDAKGCSRVRTVNQSVRNTLVSWGVPSGKVDVVPSFYLDADVFKPDMLAPKQWDIAFCARLVANKGLDDVLEAVKLLPSATLLVIGDGPLRSSFEKQAKRLGIASRVTFAGWLPSREAVVSALHAARVFVMASRSEGGPRVALEAMACGLPVVATRVGVMPEVIENGRSGIFVPSYPRPMAEAIALLLSDTALRGRMGSQAARIIERFDRKTAIAAYAKFLQSIPSRS